ncbi:hypothetical protein SAMN06295937_100783 [Sphingopyxis flava]|uniref:Uncharacterized protein n=1 Tax=Sphingopyxis flava TaxID=1507287 RepID=A0A1T5BRP1_9SPHN|nr:hypothetical protein SAMN06295937_100783 [Sphingopyxis flava]
MAHPAYAIGWSDWIRREQPNARYVYSPDQMTRYAYSKGYEDAARRDRKAYGRVAR